MAVKKFQGSQLAIGTAFGSTKSTSNISAAANAVATFEASHGIAVNDILHFLTSGWKRLENVVLRSSAVATNDVTLEGLATTDTSLFPTDGGDVSTARKISTWTTITGLFDVTGSGGGFRKTEVQEWDDFRVKEIPILAESSGLTFKGHADRQLSWFATILAAGRAGSVYPYRIIGPDGSLEYGTCYVGFTGDIVPENGVQVWNLSIDRVADPTYYAS